MKSGRYSGRVRGKVAVYPSAWGHALTPRPPCSPRSRHRRSTSITSATEHRYTSSIQPLCAPDSGPATAGDAGVPRSELRLLDLFDTGWHVRCSWNTNRNGPVVEKNIFRRLCAFLAFFGARMWRIKTATLSVCDKDGPRNTILTSTFIFVKFNLGKPCYTFVPSQHS